MGPISFKLRFFNSWPQVYDEKSCTTLQLFDENKWNKSETCWLCYEVRFYADKNNEVLILVLYNFNLWLYNKT